MRGARGRDPLRGAKAGSERLQGRAVHSQGKGSLERREGGQCIASNWPGMQGHPGCQVLRWRTFAQQCLQVDNCLLQGPTWEGGRS